MSSGKALAWQENNGPRTNEAPVELESVAQQGRRHGNKPLLTAIAAPSRHQGGVGAG